MYYIYVVVLIFMVVIYLIRGSKRVFLLKIIYYKVIFFEGKL